MAAAVRVVVVAVEPMLVLFEPANVTDSVVAVAVRLVAVAVFGVASGRRAGKAADTCLSTTDSLENADWSSNPPI